VWKKADSERSERRAPPPPGRVGEGQVTTGSGSPFSRVHDLPTKLEGGCAGVTQGVPAGVSRLAAPV